MDILQAVVTLEETLNGKKGFINKKIDIDKALSLTQFIKNNITDLISESNNVIVMRDKILHNADIVAQKTINASQEKANHMVEISEITKNANDMSKAIIDKAYAQCDVLIQKTKKHLDELMKNTENFITVLLGTISKNRDELSALQLKIN